MLPTEWMYHCQLGMHDDLMDLSQYPWIGLQVKMDTRTSPTLHVPTTIRAHSMIFWIFTVKIRLYCSKRAILIDPSAA